MTTKRFLLIGCGGIMRQHASAIESDAGRWSVSAVCDANPEAANTYAERFGATAYTDYREALAAAPGVVDAIIAAPPHFMHHEVARACLEAGLPLLMEKPVTCTVEELHDLQSLERDGVFVQAGQMQRFGNEENWLKQWLNDSGEFGDPRMFNLDVYQNIQGYIGAKSSHWILDRKTAGGGIVISVAIHILDLIRYWFGQDFETVNAFGRYEAPMKNGAESSVAASVKMSGGLIGTLNFHYTCARCPYSQRSLIYGTRGTLYQHMATPGGGYMGPFYVATDGGKPSPEWGMMYQGFTAVAEKRGPQAVNANPFLNQLRGFTESLEAGRALENSLDRNLNTIAMVEAIMKAIETEQCVSVERAAQ